MTGKVIIHYTVDYNSHHKRTYHAHIEAHGNGLLFSLHAEATTKEEARDKVVAKYREIPSPEEIDVSEEDVE